MRPQPIDTYRDKRRRTNERADFILGQKMAPPTRELDLINNNECVNDAPVDVVIISCTRDTERLVIM